MTIPRPLEVASRSYHWKPSMAWFRALELDVYLTVRPAMANPVLDLGCGDGRVAAMLERLALVEGPLFGVDLSARRLSEARTVGAHRGVVRADAGRLPFPDERFGSILCNGVLCSVPAGPTPALDEIRRVLKPGGTIVATFPTDRFLDTLLWPRLLDFWPAARSLYERRTDRRQEHYTTDSPERWRSRFEEAGVRVTRSLPFLSPYGGGIWNVLAMHAFRFLGLLKLVPGSEGPAGGLLTRALWRPFERERSLEGAGYLLVAARKSPTVERS